MSTVFRKTCWTLFFWKLSKRFIRCILIGYSRLATETKWLELNSVLKRLPVAQDLKRCSRIFTDRHVPHNRNDNLKVILFLKKMSNKYCCVPIVFYDMRLKYVYWHLSFQDVQCRYSFTRSAVTSSLIILQADLSLVHESPIIYKYLLPDACRCSSSANNVFEIWFFRFEYKNQNLNMI